jgi:hypothetical protein
MYPLFLRQQHHCGSCHKVACVCRSTWCSGTLASRWTGAPASGSRATAQRASGRRKWRWRLSGTQRAHPAMDVWALGVVLLELAIGPISSRIHVPSVLEAADMQYEPVYAQLLRMCLRYGRSPLRPQCLLCCNAPCARRNVYEPVLQVCAKSPCHSGGAPCVCEGTAKDAEQEAAAGAIG